MKTEARKTPKTLSALCFNPWWVAAGDTSYLGTEWGADLLKTVIANTATEMTVQPATASTAVTWMFESVSLPRGVKYLSNMGAHLKCEMVERCQFIIKGQRVNIWVDEEGKIKGGFQVYTQLKGARYPLAGRLMFVQARGNGETDITLTPEDIAQVIDSIWIE